MYGNRLRNLRNGKGLTMEELSEKLDMRRSTYAGYEKETRKPPLDVLITLADFHNVSVDYILGLTDNPTSSKNQNDIKEYLTQGNFTWDGVPLSEEEIKPIKDLLEIVVRDRLPKYKRKKTID